MNYELWSIYTIRNINWRCRRSRLWWEIVFLCICLWVSIAVWWRNVRVMQAGSSTSSIISVDDGVDSYYALCWQYLDTPIAVYTVIHHSTLQSVSFCPVMRHNYSVAYFLTAMDEMQCLRELGRRYGAIRELRLLVTKLKKQKKLTCKGAEPQTVYAAELFTTVRTGTWNSTWKHKTSIVRA